MAILTMITLNSYSVEPQKPESDTEITKLKKIVVIAPSSKIIDPKTKEIKPLTSEQISQLKDYCKDFNLEIQIEPDLFSCEGPESNANTVQYRLDHLKKSLDDPDVEILWAIRGGYGAVKLIKEFLNQNPDYQPNGNKLLIGYSDITALHLLFNNKFNMNSVHGAVILEFFHETKVKNGKNLIQTITKKLPINYQLTALNNVSKNFKINNIKLTGGNLSVLLKSKAAGLWKKEDCDNKILFVEEAWESPGKIVDFLQTIDEVYENIEALIVGDCTWDNNEDMNKQLKEYFLSSSFEDIFKNKGKPIPPVFRISDIGHTETQNSLILGASYQIKYNRGNNYSLISKTLSSNKKKK